MQIQLETECKWRQIQRVPYLRRWIDLKPFFHQRYGSGCASLHSPPPRILVSNSLSMMDLVANSDISDVVRSLFCSAHGLKGSVERAGLTWDGRAHSGLDDAKWVASPLVALVS